jgi:ABC-type Na+ efflux pump permease subunit
MMQDIVTVMRKELWELRHSARHLYWLLALIALPIMLRFDSDRSLIPVAFFYAILPSLVAMAASAQIVFDSILGEKRAKTLEVLLSTNIPTVAIVVGKIVPAIGVGYVLSQISLLGLMALPFPDTPVITSSSAWLLLGFPLLISYAASCTSVVAVALVPDEKIAPTVAVLISVAPLVLLGRISEPGFKSTSIGLIVTLAVLLCGFATWLAALALRRIPLITRL